MINRIHHINFLVRDLDSAIKRYQSLLQVDNVIREELPQRSVSTARFKVGETWIVLVQPYNPDTIPGQQMKEHGEGFFLISYQTDDLESESDRISESGIEVLDRLPRQGLDDWQVKDVLAEDLFGVSTQITESNN